jgi:hypothetical protein
MSLVMQKLKALAVRFDCAILIVHHTRKGRPGSDEPAEQAERISGAAAIVNLARKAVMPVTMTETEAKAYPSVLPSERLKYFKLADVKSNLAPLAAEAPWYELVTVARDFGLLGRDHFEAAAGSLGVCARWDLFRSPAGSNPVAGVTRLHVGGRAPSAT